MSRTLVDSDIKWLGKIPKDWKIKKIKNVLNERNEMNKDGKEDFILSLTIADGVLPYNDKKTGGNKAKEDITKYKIAKKNDIIINSMNVVVGAAGLSNYNGIISPVYYAFYEKNKISNSKYYYYLFLNKTYQDYLFGMGNGIMVKMSDESGKMNTIRKKIPIDKLKCDFVPYPSVEEQIKIADYLDKKCKKIDSAIEDNKKAIELLKQYKKIKINEVVKRGINKSVEMKDSNNRFIGLIPSHWKISKAKYIADTLSKGKGITKEEVFPDGDVQCIRYGEIYSKYDTSIFKTFSRTFLNKIENPKYLYKGDIIFTITGELIEEIGKNVVYLGDEPCLAGGDMLILKHSQNPSFMNYALNCISSQEQKSIGKLKLKVVHISASEIGNVLIAIPPIDEQDKIANYLDDFCSKIDNVMDYRKLIIEKLEEYKKSLIYEVVTGKKEV